MIYRRLCLGLLLLGTLPGCTSIMVNGSGTGLGHPYVGTERAVKDLPCRLMISSFLAFIPAPFFLVDVPLSAAADTVVLPVDLVVEPRHERQAALRLRSLNVCL